MPGAGRALGSGCRGVRAEQWQWDGRERGGAVQLWEGGWEYAVTVTSDL